MKIIVKELYESGAYPSIQEGDVVAIPDGFALWPDTLDTADFYAYNGFVTLTIEQVDGVDTVTAYAPNVEAWEAWKATLSEKSNKIEEPTQLDRIEAQIIYTAMMTDTLLEV